MLFAVSGENVISSTNEAAQGLFARGDMLPGLHLTLGHLVTWPASYTALYPFR